MIKRLRVKNFKALRDVEIELTPIHVLIGPNDSGKTSILDALAAICRSVDHDLAEAFLGQWKGSELVWSGEPGLSVTFEVDFDGEAIASYLIDISFGQNDRVAAVDRELVRTPDGDFAFPLHVQASGRWARLPSGDPKAPLDTPAQVSRLLRDALTGVHYYRWDPRFLALPVAPIPSAVSGWSRMVSAWPCASMKY